MLFFCQAEDGIRDVAVTGVQTCALPISIPAGSGTSTITVTARDANGNPIGGASVSLTATGGTGKKPTPAPGTTDPTTGVLTATVSSDPKGARTNSTPAHTLAVPLSLRITLTAREVQP